MGDATGNWNSNQPVIAEKSLQQLTRVLEDIFTKKQFDTEFVNQNNNNLYINHAPSITSVNLTGDNNNIFPTDNEDLVCNNSGIIEIDNDFITSETGYFFR